MGFANQLITGPHIEWALGRLHKFHGLYLVELNMNQIRSSYGITLNPILYLDHLDHAKYVITENLSSWNNPSIGIVDG